MTLVKQRGDEILSRLPDGSVRGAEVGVWDGRLSRYLLETNNSLSLFMVDRWRAVDASHPYAKSESKMARTSETEFAEIYRRAMKVASRYSGRAIVKQGESVDMADHVEPESLDFVFVDACHTFEGVLSDLKAWAEKVKPGGWLCGHDWEHPDHVDSWGVREAVEEFTADLCGEIELGNNRTWFFRL